jgi:formylglycine-generating enzyme required for sulfatase activity
LCTDAEWERAARGADRRRDPHGDSLDGDGRDDTNRDETYDRVPEAFGPDEVGAHPASDSPFGLADLCGNVWEYVLDQSVVSLGGATLFRTRGGSWYQGALSSLATNRAATEPTLRSPLNGVRVCATAPK